MCNEKTFPPGNAPLPDPSLITSTVTGDNLLQRFKISIKYLNCNNGNT